MCLKCDYNNLPPEGNGELAQMVERSIRIREAPGSIPGFSTAVSSCIHTIVCLFVHISSCTDLSPYISIDTGVTLVISVLFT